MSAPATKFEPTTTPTRVETIKELLKIAQAAGHSPWPVLFNLLTKGNSSLQFANMCDTPTDDQICIWLGQLRSFPPDRIKLRMSKAKGFMSKGDTGLISLAADFDGYMADAGQR